jgi:UDP-N-acetylmuramate dehydrogenase
MRDIRNHSLLPHNTFGIDAHCSRFLEYQDIQEAQQVAQILRESDAPYLIIGGGSNLLLTKDFEGIVVHSAIKGISIDNDRMLCGSGEVWDDVVAYAVAHGLYGMENLSLIPGDVGASAVQNIGAYGVEACQLIDSVEAVEIATGNVVVIPVADCDYAYRYSKFKTEWKNRFLITRVTYRISETFEPCLGYGNIRAELERKGIGNPTAQQVRETIIEIRNAKLPDPKVEGNAGSFFMNPVVSRAKYEELVAQNPQMPHYYIDEAHEKIPAGWMIDQCGWKGRSLGRAGVHDKQALVLVNRGGATGNEVVALCREIQRDVKEKFGIDISPEVNIV